MEAVAVADPVEFLERAGPLLEPNEARHNLILGLAGTLRDRPEVYEEHHLWIVEHADRPVAAALLTPPFNLVLADSAHRGALETLAAAVLAAGVAVPGAVGNRPTIEQFNPIWTGLTGTDPVLRMAQGVFALEELIPVEPPPGAPRAPAAGERDLVVAWMVDFHDEALPDGGPARHRLEAWVERVLGSSGDPTGGIWLWQDQQGAPVSLTAYASPTPHGIRIGPVYTPPDLRCRGYGTALVAAVSAWLLEQGRSFCFLYTDLANPTSNALYRRIGYEQVAESAEYGYADAG